MKNADDSTGIKTSAAARQKEMNESVLALATKTRGVGSALSLGAMSTGSVSIEDPSFD
jgi:hypothetical protein